MRLTRFALMTLVVMMVIFAAVSSYSQQAEQQPQAQGQGRGAQAGGGGGGAGAGQGAGGRGVNASPMATAEQALQEAQRLTREGRGGGGGGGGQQGRGGQPGAGGAQAPDEVPETYIKQYVNTTDLFSVSVPCTFTSRDITWDTEYDLKVPGRVYSCRHAPTSTDYEMSVINYTDIIAIRRAAQHTPAAGGDAYARIDLAASIDYAATRLRNEGKVTYDAWHYINLIPGHDLKVTLPNGKRVYAAIYLHEYRLYIMKATTEAMGIPPLLYTQSFAITRADGTSIRYPSIYRHPW